jgi:hypothetical protein
LPGDPLRQLINLCGSPAECVHMKWYQNWMQSKYIVGMYVCKYHDEPLTMYNLICTNKELNFAMSGHISKVGKHCFVHLIYKGPQEGVRTPSTKG